MKLTTLAAAFATLLVAGFAFAGEPGSACPAGCCRGGAAHSEECDATDCAGIDAPTCACEGGKKCCCEGTSVCGCGCGCGDGKKCECSKPKQAAGCCEKGGCCTTASVGCCGKGCSPKDAALVRELLSILDHTKSTDTYLLTLNLLARMDVDAVTLVPALIRNAERLGVLADHIAEDGDDESLAGGVAEAIATLLRKDTAAKTKPATPTCRPVEYRQDQ